jgi:hypothetical protein
MNKGVQMAKGMGIAGQPALMPHTYILVSPDDAAALQRAVTAIVARRSATVILDDDAFADADKVLKQGAD